MSLTCIKQPVPKSNKWYNKIQFPIEGNEYTIRGKMTYPNNRISYLLQEIKNKPIVISGKMIEPGFPAEYFADTEDWIEAKNQVNELLESVEA